MASIVEAGANGDGARNIAMVKAVSSTDNQDHTTTAANSLVTVIKGKDAYDNRIS